MPGISIVMKNKGIAQGHVVTLHFSAIWISLKIQKLFICGCSIVL